MYFISTRSLRHLATALFLVALAFSGGVFAQQDTRGNGLSRGREAITRLGARLPAVAARHGKTPTELRRLFLEDPTLHLDEKSDALLYIDAGVDQADASSASVPTTEAAPFPYSETFRLHSRPGSNRVIFLDFDGYVTQNTQWNASYTSGAPINSAPYSLDSDPATFNQQEQDAIQYIWQRVAEDYAPFDVDVTTEDPGDAAIYRSSTSDLQYGTRAVISPTNFTGSSIGGIAYVGVFNYVGTKYQPAFIMTSGLGNNEKNIAEAASHEVGHNLGLSHDGKTNADGTTTAYYSGQGDWAPIMGVGYYKAVTQWSKGEYPGANQLQDDLAVMQTYGIAVIPDDHGNTNAAATVLSGASVSASGVITTRADVDVFRFTTGSGSVTLNFNPAPRGANLDIQARITDAAGNAIATVNPAGLPASFTGNLTGGTYYVTIDGTGAGDAATGYSDYASLGQYSITGTLVATNQQPPTASASANVTSGVAPLTVAFSSVGSTDPDGSITNYSWNFGDGSAVSTEANPVHVYNAAGTFTATLTVTDNSNLTATSSVAITATSAPNQPPVASASANVTSGAAPLAVSFSSAGSADPDGSIASYAWNFGNGATSNVANPSYTYTVPGNYTAVLTVTDNAGATASSSVAIAVSPAPSTDIYVASISMSVVRSGKNSAGRAVVTVRDASGAVRPNVTVSARWSGLTNDTDAVTTDANGQAVITSNNTKSRGTFTFTVTNLAAAGFTYNASRNVATSASVSN